LGLLASETYLEALISVLSQHRSLENWTDPCSGTVTLADTARGIVLQQIQILFMEKKDLVFKFKDLNGFQTLEDILSYTLNEDVKVEVLHVLCVLVDKHATLLLQLGMMEHLNKLSTEGKTERLRNFATFLIPRLANCNPTQVNRAHMPEDAVQAAISLVISPTEGIDKKTESLTALASMTSLNSSEDSLLKYLKDGVIQPIFEQILPLTKDGLLDSKLYHTLETHILSAYIHEKHTLYS
jgi:hypothetical protein